MLINSIIKRAEVLFCLMLIFLPFGLLSQNIEDSTINKRSEVAYKQVHSSGLSDQSDLFADRLKLKLDLDVLDETKELREPFDPNDIPADEIYGGVWLNNHVNIYSSLKNAPDTFIVDLDNFTMPVEGRMTSNFGRRGGRRYHYGIDIKAETGDTIYAAFDGKIRVKQFERRGYGYYLVIRHLNGLETVYGHLSKFLVEENDFVLSGQPIGLAGNTGRSFGSHLHFETRFLGKAINPNFIIDFQNKAVHQEEYLVTNSSYNQTNSSSRVVVTENSPSAKESAGESNKFISGEVKYHRVSKGDTLSAISARYGTSVTELCRLNNISTRTILRIGRSLRIS